MHEPVHIRIYRFIRALNDSEIGSRAFRIAHSGTARALFSHHYFFIRSEQKNKRLSYSLCHGATDWRRSSRSADLLSGLVGLIGATGWMPPRDVESAADTLRGVLIGRTAQTAAKMLSDVAALGTVASAGTSGTEQKSAGYPATAVGEALLAWKEGRGLMKVSIIHAVQLWLELDLTAKTVVNTGR